MFNPIITPSHTAVIFAPGSINKIGATIGTTTTAISIKSRKKPKTNITIITIINWLQNPPGIPTKKSLTTSSPPKPRKAAVSIAAPNKIIKTNEVVLAVSSITPLRVSSILNALQALHPIASSKPIVPITAKITPITSSLV